jgi:hypothetical protein
MYWLLCQCEIKIVRRKSRVIFKLARAAILRVQRAGFTKAYGDPYAALMLIATQSRTGGKSTMKQSSIAVCILSLALATLGNAQGTASSKQTGEHYTQSRLKKLVNEAHTSDQYDVLARYYGNEQQSFLQKAADEKQEWAHRSQFSTSISAKYPKPVDSARNLYEYYAYKASEAGVLSEKYRRLARPTVAQ